MALLGRLPSAGANICVATRASQKPAQEAPWYRVKLAPPDGYRLRLEGLLRRYDQIIK